MVIWVLHVRYVGSCLVVSTDRKVITDSIIIQYLSLSLSLCMGTLCSGFQ